MLRINDEKKVYLGDSTNNKVNFLIFQFLYLAINQSDDHKIKITRIYAEKLLNILKEQYPDSLEKQKPLKKQRKNMELFLEALLHKPNAHLFVAVCVMKCIGVGEYDDLLKQYNTAVSELNLGESELPINNIKVVMAVYKDFSYQYGEELDLLFKTKVLPTMLAGLSCALYHSGQLYSQSWTDNIGMNDEELDHLAAQNKRSFMGIMIAMVPVITPFMYLAHRTFKPKNPEIIDRFLKDRRFSKNADSLISSFTDLVIPLNAYKPHDAYNHHLLNTASNPEMYQAPKKQEDVVHKIGKEEITEVTSVLDRKKDINNNNTPGITRVPFFAIVKPRICTGDSAEVVKTDWVLCDESESRITLNENNLFKYEPVTSEDKFKSDIYYIYIDDTDIPAEQVKRYQDLSNLSYLSNKDIWSSGTSLGNRLVGVEISHPDRTVNNGAHLIFMFDFEKHDQYTKNLKRPGYREEVVEMAIRRALKPKHSAALMHG